MTDKPWPQLRIYHLLTVTAVAALLLGVQGPLPAYVVRGEPLPALRVAVGMWSMLVPILWAVAITVVAYGIAWRRRGLHFFNQPGHWLFVQIASVPVVSTFTHLAFGATKWRSYMDGEIWPTLAMALVDAVIQAGFNVYIGLRHCNERGWRFVFFAKAVASIVPAFGHILVVVLLTRVALIDRRQRLAGDESNVAERNQLATSQASRVRRRDRIHWCGVAVELALCIVSVLMAVFLIVSLR